MGTINCDGDYTFTVQVDIGDADDLLVMANAEITALRFR
jgi:hypothetical protein